jgi:hypothetical protein
MSVRARSNAVEYFVLIAFMPFALAGGFFHGLIAHKLSKGREPWFTLLMLIGLGGTIFGIQWVSHDLGARTAWLFIAMALLYVGLRLLFGRGGGQSLEAFLMPHMCAILMCLLLPTLDQIKAKRSRQQNAPDTHQNAPR